MSDREADPYRALSTLVSPVDVKITVRKDPTRPYVGLENIRSSGAHLVGWSLASSSISTNSVFQAGDVLFGKLRPNLRKCVIAPFDGYCSTDILVLRPKIGIDPSFAGKVLRTERVGAAAEMTAVGTKMPRTSWKQLSELKVFCPAPPEQSKIAHILDTLDTAIHETEAIIAKLKAVKQGLLHDLLTRGIDANGELRPPRAEAPHLYKESALGWIPEEWGICPLEDLAEVSRGKFTHRPRNDPRFYGGNYPFIQTGDVAAAGGELVSNYSQTLSERGTSVSQEFPAGTIAITIAANIADTAILAIPMYFPDSVVGAVVRPEHNVRFVELSIRKAKPVLDARAPQSAQKNINLQNLRPLLLAVPDRAEQDAIASRYEALQCQLQKEDEALAKYRFEKAGLMDDLLTGRVRVAPLLDAAAP
ncbi:MAG: restriction endonuclease subunit S [Gammaproteobacteria bacterium]